MPLEFDPKFDESIILNQRQSSLMKVVLNEDFVRQVDLPRSVTRSRAV